jgi:hypothetical protein
LQAVSLLNIHQTQFRANGIYQSRWKSKDEILLDSVMENPRRQTYNIIRETVWDRRQKRKFRIPPKSILVVVCDSELNSRGLKSLFNKCGETKGRWVVDRALKQIGILFISFEIWYPRVNNSFSPLAC